MSGHNREAAGETDEEDDGGAVSDAVIFWSPLIVKSWGILGPVSSSNINYILT